MQTNQNVVCDKVWKFGLEIRKLLPPDEADEASLVPAELSAGSLW